MRINRTAAEGFQAGAVSYDRARPDYPTDAVAWLSDALRIGPGSRVVDLGAGTGKLTRLLVPSGASIVAVEPVEAMRARLAETLPEVRVTAGTAERIPLAGGSVNAVVAAQAFHWFDGPVALRELHRVLVPDGRLGLVWNTRTGGEGGWLAEFEALFDHYGAEIPRFKDQEWRRAFERTELFTPLEERVFPYAQELTEEGFVERVASVSAIAALPETQRQAAIARFLELLRTHPDTRGRATVELPYRTQVFWCERRGD